MGDGLKLENVWEDQYVFGKNCQNIGNYFTKICWKTLLDKDVRNVRER